MNDAAAHHLATERAISAGRATLTGQRRGLRAFLPFVGPAVIASVAYMDPGNFAVNIEAGASFGYALLWVVLLANVVAMLFQALSAKLGVVTGQSLAGRNQLAGTDALDIVPAARRRRGQRSLGGGRWLARRRLRPSTLLLDLGYGECQGVVVLVSRSTRCGR